MLARREAARFRKEVNSTLVDRSEVGMGGEAGVAHHLSWQSGVPVFPKLNDPQDFIIVIRFAHAGMGIDQHVRLGIPRQKGQDTFLSATAFGHVMRFHQRVRVFPVPGNGRDVEIERPVAAQIRLQSVQGAIPTIHEACTGLWIRSPGVLGEA